MAGYKYGVMIVLKTEDDLNIANELAKKDECIAHAVFPERNQFNIMLSSGLKGATEWKDALLYNDIEAHVLRFEPEKKAIVVRDDDFPIYPYGILLPLNELSPKRVSEITDEHGLGSNRGLSDNFEVRVAVDEDDNSSDAAWFYFESENKRDDVFEFLKLFLGYPVQSVNFNVSGDAFIIEDEEDEQ